MIKHICDECGKEMKSEDPYTLYQAGVGEIELCNEQCLLKFAFNEVKKANKDNDNKFIYGQDNVNQPEEGRR